MEVDIKNIPLESYPKGITNDGFHPQNTIMIHTLAFGAETTSTKEIPYHGTDLLLWPIFDHVVREFIPRLTTTATRSAGIGRLNFRKFQFRFHCGNTTIVLGQAIGLLCGQ